MNKKLISTMSAMAALMIADLKVGRGVAVIGIKYSDGSVAA